MRSRAQGSSTGNRRSFADETDLLRMGGFEKGKKKIL